jgi:hypothetical protein
MCFESLTCDLREPAKAIPECSCQTIEPFQRCVCVHTQLGQSMPGSQGKQEMLNNMFMRLWKQAFKRR